MKPPKQLDVVVKAVLRTLYSLSKSDILDKELALTLSCKLTEYFNFVFVDLDNIDQSVAGVERVTLLQLTDSIFRLETEKVKKDILSCSQTYKCLPGLLQLRTDSWMEGRNEVLPHAVGALCHSGIKDVQKTVALNTKILTETMMVD